MQAKTAKEVKLSVDSSTDVSIDKWALAAQRAQRTATWAKTMTKLLISQSTGSEPRWHVINFLGPKKSEARGIVDLIAIRRDHRLQTAPLKRGDLFEIVLLQVKGGQARWPSSADRERLRAVKAAYGATHVLLSEWKQGAKARLYRLEDDEWVELSDPAAVFSPGAKPAVRKKAQQLVAKHGVSDTSADASTGQASADRPDKRRSAAAKKAWAARRANFAITNR